MNASIADTETEPDVNGSIDNNNSKSPAKPLVNGGGAASNDNEKKNGEAASTAITAAPAAGNNNKMDELYDIPVGEFLPLPPPFSFLPPITSSTVLPVPLLCHHTL